MTLEVMASEHFSTVSFPVNSGDLLFISGVKEFLKCRFQFNNSGMHGKKSADGNLKSQVF